MTQNLDRPKRPNENYNLSKPDKDYDGKEEIKFHYNRERRLENASHSVQELYTTKKQSSRFNLIAPLIGDKPRIVLLLTILILCVTVLVLSIFNRFTGFHSLDGNRLEISGIRYEGVTIIALRKTNQLTGLTANRNPWTGAVDIAVSPPVPEGEDFLFFQHRVYFTMEPEEQFRFAVPFDSPELLMVIRTGISDLHITLRPN